MQNINVQPTWEVAKGDAEIMEIPKADHFYFGHSTSIVDWLLAGRGLRMNVNDGNGSISITTLDTPSNPKEFLDDLKERVDPEGPCHKGKYLVVLAVPPHLYLDTGFLYDVKPNDNDWRPPFGVRNVKMIEPDIESGGEDDFIIPPRFILGYYDGNTNSFHKNPLWEESPAATDFGLAAERRRLDFYSGEPAILQESVSTHAMEVAKPINGEEDDIW
jgi:hypothetical protein